ncbi:unnamed protein product [Citrullus colocynthis]|uniref:Uncharacterized protein n=1 Tax=Citrullus colocynthis TaxID=252529 RepID=A0ABP0Z5R2_9ROSI
MAALQRENETDRERMSSLEWSKAREKMIEEQAKDELEALQLLYPNRFEYLKLELKSFIHLLQSQSEDYFPQPNPILASKRSPSSLAPDSQESSSCRKRRKMEEGRKRLQREVAESESETGEKIVGRKDRVDEVLERAAICLSKIRRLKTALFSTAG